MNKLFTCLTALVCVLFISNSTFSQTYPSVLRNVSPGVSAPGDAFSPSLSGGAVTEAPQAAEWTRTAGPDESIVLTGYQLSRFSGTEEGKDTRFLVYASGGVKKEARLQRLDAEKAIITLDASLPSWSMYLIWPGNDAGWGAPMAVNKTDAWWLGPDKAKRGATISVFGRNLAHGNVEGTSNSYVYIKSLSGSSSQWATVTKVNPYRVDFTVPSSLSNGDYEVWMHNGHGGDYGWSGPLKFSVWDGANWTGNTINVKDYGARGDGSTDDATAVKRAIEEAKNRPGSTLYFPAGTYMISTLLDAHSNTRWVGEGRDKTILKCTPNFSSPYAFVFGEPENFELNDMTIDANKNFRGGTGQPVFLRKSSDVRINNVLFSCQNYEPIDVHYSKRVFVTNCEFIGRAFFVGSASQLFIDHSTFKMTNDADMAIYAWGANGLSLTNSTCQDFDNSNPSDLSGWGKGRFMTGAGNWGSNRNTYLASNTTNDLTPSPYSPDQNSGEQFMWEGNTPSWRGTPSSATANTISLGGYSTNEPDKNYIVVIKGKGLGQSRRVISNNGGTATIDEPWNVIPDGNSVVTVGPFVDRVAVYKNFLDAKPRAVSSPTHIAAAGIEPYGGALNFIADNNTLHELRYGTSNWSQQWNDLPWAPNYFTMYSNNKYVGCYVGMHTATDAKNPYGTAIFGTTYRGNTVERAVMAAIHNDVATQDFPLLSSFVYEKNNITNSPAGFSIGWTSHPKEIFGAGGMENQVFYKNSFSGAGVGITASSKMAIRQNNYSGFSPLYSGAMLPGGVIEAPSRVIEIPAQPNGSVVKTVLSIWNSGTETLDWSAQSHTSWLGLSSTSGSIAHEGESSVLELSANPQNLSQGVHKGYVSVTNGGQTKNYTILLNVGSSTSTNPIAPIISLTAPQTNTSYTSPATITISANASDPDGSITKVEFFQGSTKLGEDVSAPYSFEWSGATANSYSLSAKATDNSGMTTISQVNSITIAGSAPSTPSSSACSGTGAITWEYINDVAWGTSLSSIADAQASGSRQLSSFSSPQNFAEHYGACTKGYICPPATGQYTFYLAADDLAELWLSTDGNPANKQRIAAVDTWTNAGQYDQSSSQKSVSINLTAGQIYYIEVRHIEFNGGDNMSVAWRLPDGTMQAPIAGAHLLPYTGKGESIVAEPIVPSSSACSGTGAITWEYINDVAWGTSLSSIADAQASGSRQLSSFSSPQNFAEYYGARTKGYICPPASGQYTFYLAADDLAELWLSTDGNPANKQRIAAVDTWTNAGQYDQSSSQKSVSITLTAGQRYYIEVRHIEFNGGDNMSVAWRLPDGTMQAPIAGAHLLPYTGKGESIVAEPIVPSSSACSGTGAITWEYINDVAWGTSLSSIADAQASGSRQLSSFSSPQNFAEHYGARTKGYICPPASGQYTFYLAADDLAELWLSTDGNPANKQRIAAVDTWTNAGQYDQSSSQKSVSINLTAGQIYYIEVRHIEFNGGDNMSVAWRLPDGTMQAPIAGAHLLPYTGKGESIVAEPIVPSSSACSGTGAITWEYINDVAWGTSLSSIADAQASGSRQLSSFSSPQNFAEYYGARTKGYICPPASGQYTFYLAADDLAELWLSTDGNPANKQRIAAVDTWTNAGQYDQSSSQKSVSITLTAGQRYYIEVRHIEFNGGDNMSVAWRLPDGTMQAPIAGAHLLPYTGVLSTARLKTSPTDKAQDLSITKEPLKEDKFNIYPNPFEEQTTIEFALVESTKVKLQIYNQQGALVKTIYRGNVTGGTLSKFTFNANNLASGVYFCRLVADKKTLQQKIVLIK